MSLTGTCSEHPEDRVGTAALKDNDAFMFLVKKTKPAFLSQ